MCRRDGAPGLASSTGQEVDAAPGSGGEPHVVAVEPARQLADVRRVEQRRGIQVLLT
jgi:hypothetical protein